MWYSALYPPPPHNSPQPPQPPSPTPNEPACVILTLLDICILSLLPPATKLGQGYVFTRVCDSVQGGLDQAPPGSRHLPRKQTPQHSACWEIRATSGRYASYWNAILFIINFILTPAGDEVQVVYASGSDVTPLVALESYYYNGFTGFRIWVTYQIIWTPKRCLRIMSWI